MAVFQSKYRELSFYVNGEKHSFSNGSFSTDNVEIIAVLDTLTDAVRVDEPKKPEAPKVEQPKDSEPQPEVKPKTARKTSAK